MSFLDDWKEWSTPKKAISIIAVCCVAIFLIAMIGGATSPDKNTSEDLTKDNSTANTNTLTVQDTDTNESVYWRFTGVDSEAYGRLYDYCLITTDDGNNYYLDANSATSMWEYEPAFYAIDKAVMDAEDNGKYYIYSTQGIGIIKSAEDNTPTDLKYGFSFKNSNNMTIEWQKGKDVGMDHDTREITSITIDGKKIF